MKIKNQSINISSAIESMKNGFSSANNGNGFDNLLNNMSSQSKDIRNSDNVENNNKSNRVDKNASGNKADKKDLEKLGSNETKKNISEINDTNVSNRNVDNKATNKTKETEKLSESKDVKEIETVDLSKEDEKLKTEKLIEDLSGILGVGKEVLVQTMEKLDLTIMDLANNENLINLLAEINGFTEQAELLTLDNLTGQLAEIKQLVEEASVKGTVDLTLFEEVDENDTSLETKEYEELVETTEEVELALQANNQDEELSEENTDSETNKKTEESQKHMTSIIDSKDVKPEFIFNTELEVDDDVISEEALASINGVAKGESFVNQVGKEISGRNINTADVVKQLVEAMKVDVKVDTASEIKVMLKPAHLGDVTLKIAAENGIIIAQFVAENERVKAIIESNFNVLRDSLLEQGVDVGQLEVTVSDHGGQSGFENQDNGYNVNQNGQFEGYDDEMVEINTSSEDKNKVLGSTVDYSA